MLLLSLMYLKCLLLKSKDIDYLAELWLKIYGNQGAKTSSYNHHYLQGIIEHGINEWKFYGKKIHPELRKIIIEKYPQLTTV